MKQFHMTIWERACGKHLRLSKIQADQSGSSFSPALEPGSNRQRDPNGLPAVIWACFGLADVTAAVLLRVHVCVSITQT